MFNLKTNTAWIISSFPVSNLVFQSLIKDPKLAGIVMNPHVKRNIKQKTFTEALTKAKLSPMTVNLISEWLAKDTEYFVH